MLCSLLAVAALLVSANAGPPYHPEPAQYRPFPPLKEQARILDGWRQERFDAIPELLKKYNVDGWFVSNAIVLFICAIYQHIHTR